jgi:DNA-binding PadR family transcriptional regulator
MYELFLLGKLMERPWYGYEFQKVLNAFVGPVRQVSWGTVYPMLRRLEKEGLIRLAPSGADPENGRARQRFAITAEGRTKFRELMHPDQLNDANYRDTLRVMMGNFSRVDSATRRRIVDAYLRLASSVISHAEQMAIRVQGASELTLLERADILVALDRDRYLAAVDRDWITERIDRLMDDR